MQCHADHEDAQQGQRGGSPGQHRDHRPPRQHRDLRRQQVVGDGAQPRDFGLDAGEALHQSDVAERVGGALGEVGIVPLDGALQHFGPVDDEGGQGPEHGGDGKHYQPERPIQVDRKWQQHDQGSGRRERVAEEVEPQAPQRVGPRQHHLHQAAGMRFAVKHQRQLQHVVEEIGQHRLPAAMGETIRVERHGHPHHDGEQPEADPGRDQPDQVRPRRGGALGLGAGEGIDDPPEQHRLGEHGAGEREIGHGQIDAELLFRAEQGEHPGVEVQKAHVHRWSARVCAKPGRRARRCSSSAIRPTTSIGVAGADERHPESGRRRQRRALTMCSRNSWTTAWNAAVNVTSRSRGPRQLDLAARR